MSKPLVILAGVSEKEDTGLYRRHNYLGKNKAGLPFMGSHLLTESLTQYSEAGYDPIDILGKKEHIEPYIPKALQANVIEDLEGFGDKLRWFKIFGEEMVRVVPWDLVPSVDDLRTFESDISWRWDVSAYIPFIEGDDLIKNGFRKDRGHKMYPVRNNGKIDFFSASQMYAFRPSRLKLENVAKIADARFRSRELGLRNPAVLFSLLWNVCPTPGEAYRVAKVLAGISLKPGNDGEYRDSWARRIPTYKEVSKAMCPILKPEYREKSCVEIGLLRAPTLAMDIDCAEDKETLELYYTGQSAKPYITE